MMPPTPDPPSCAPAHFPYAHATLEQADTSDPIAWRLANKARFDAIYGADNASPWSDMFGAPLAARLAAARQWRIDNKPRFDAIYGP